MKRNYLFKNIARLSVIVALLGVSLLQSCKDNSPGSIDFSKSPALVAFQYAGFQATPYTAALLPNAGVVYSQVEVTLSVASITLKSPVTVNLLVDDAGAQAYIKTDTLDGAGNKKLDHQLPASLYTMPSKITIAPGQQIVVVKIVFAADKIDFTQNYILALKLSDPSGAQLTTNLNNAIIALTLKSPYQGLYTVSGSFIDNTSASSGITDAGIYPISNTQLQTKTANTVDFYDPTSYGGNSGYYTGINSGGSKSVYGSFDPEFTFDPTTNKVVAITNYYGQNSGAHLRSAILDPSVPSTSSGTPGTVGFKFTVGFIMTQAGSPRTYYNETFTYTGPL